MATGRLSRLSLQIVLIALVIGMLAVAGLAVRRTLGPPPGSSERSTTTIACVKCGAESIVTDKQFAELAAGATTGALRCPKCGEPAAYVASLRCPKCHRAVPRSPQLMSGPFVCPYCQAPLAGDLAQPPQP